ncbi:MAG: hypothetical protein EOP84_03580 [Verrucomicrobiaceae bacterium]|nr:MAG: hypothetical protein EOP84_03580 [Verrucomicrobiaceae bacterium]
MLNVKTRTVDMVHWEQCAEDFRWDGSLRDIYITPATLADWQTTYPFLRDYPEGEYSIDGAIQCPPMTVDEVFALRGTASPMLRFQVGRTLVVFHFFCEEEIECDIDPREDSSEDDLNTLLEFVRDMGNTTGKVVVITAENYREQPIISYNPETCGFRYHETVA